MAKIAKMERIKNKDAKNTEVKM
jgi:hypothetical protein